MLTEIAKITKQNRRRILEKAANMIKGGRLVVFPTETVYGLGANARDEKALKKIFSAKGRPSDNPIIVHISKKNQLKELADNVTERQKKLMDAFWPGPLTIVFDKKKTVSDIVSGGLPTIAVRLPSHAFARELIDLAGVPIAAPSANISGRPSGTKIEDIADDLSGKVDMIIDAGESEVGLESTVVKINSDRAFILRPGAVTKEMLEKVLRPLPVIFAKNKKDLHSSPGTRHKHYAPKAKLEIVSGFPGKAWGNMLARASVLRQKGLKIGVIGTSRSKKHFKEYEPNVFVLGNGNNLKEISQKLYRALRFFDARDIDIILCQSFPEKGLGAAIMDRLRRASAK